MIKEKKNNINFIKTFEKLHGKIYLYCKSQIFFTDFYYRNIINYKNAKFMKKCD